MFMLTFYSMCPGRHLEKWIGEAGFIDFTCTKILLPLGTWAKNKKAVRLSRAARGFADKKAEKGWGIQPASNAARP
jgi:hypothetical protein